MKLLLHCTTGNELDTCRRLHIEPELEKCFLIIKPKTLEEAQRSAELKDNILTIIISEDYFYGNSNDQRGYAHAADQSNRENPAAIQFKKDHEIQIQVEISINVKSGSVTKKYSANIGNTETFNDYSQRYKDQVNEILS